ncbi:phosphoglycolate phosphatase [Bosea sp. PAMC 26642]|uniref:phosphoglycolate phosphatase n=1 Tax=Bosea sp. (strain PAMC 26642) TaxID=1792307 RepID=UPI0009E6CFE3|nr:phosphoglycolate phosphatase [Bosea sp. PAMC 26642]
MSLPPIVVFDLDGTLAETAPDIMRVLNVILAREGLPVLPLERARELVGAGARALIERGFKVSGRPLDAETLERLFEDFLLIYAQDVAADSFLFDGVLEAMEALSSEGYLLAVCTNKPILHTRLILDHFGITERFASVAGRDSFPFHKPDPRHLTMTIEAGGGDPKRAVMIGDSRTDIDTARAAGIPSICVPFGYTDVAIGTLNPDMVIQHFDELPGAVAKVATRWAAMVGDTGIEPVTTPV